MAYTLDNKEIYNNFLKYSGLLETKERPLFRKATKDELKSLTEIYENCVKAGAKREDLAELEGVATPEKLVHFYKEMNPDDVYVDEVLIDAARSGDANGIRLLDLAKIQKEYTEYTPSCELIRWGFLVIGTLGDGDVLAVDLKDQNLAVYYATHDENYDDDYQSTARAGSKGCPEFLRKYKVFVNIFGEPKEPEPMNHDYVKKSLPLVAKSFEEFIEKLSKREKINVQL